MTVERVAVQGQQDMVEKILPSIAAHDSKRLHFKFDEWRPDTQQQF